MKLIKRNLLFLFLFMSHFFSSIIFAMDLQLQNIQSISIEGQMAHIQLFQMKSGTPRMQLQGGDESLWKWKLDGTQVVLNDQYASQNPVTINLYLLTDQVLFIALKAGKVSFQNTQLKDFQIRLLNGIVQGQQHKGSLSINQHGGEFVLSATQGDLESESVNATVKIAQHQGGIKVKSLNGQVQLQDITGAIQVDQHAGTIKLNQLKGPVILTANKPEIVVNNLKGRMEGELKEGTLRFNLNEETSVNLKAPNSKVIVESTSGVGSFFNLTTLSGEISVKPPLKVALEGKFKVVRGKLPGEGGGRVSIRGDELSVIVK